MQFDYALHGSLKDEEKNDKAFEVCTRSSLLSLLLQKN